MEKKDKNGIYYLDCCNSKELEVKVMEILDNKPEINRKELKWENVAFEFLKEIL